MKDSGIEWIGEIPEDWEVQKLKYGSDCNSNTLSENIDDEKLIRYIDIGAVTNEYGIQEIQTFIFKDAPNRARRIIKENDTIISTVRTYLKAIAYVPKEYNDYICSTGFAVVAPKKCFNGKYMFYSLNADWFVSTIESRSTGISYPAINASSLVNFKMLVPPILEQVIIATYLDSKCTKIDETIEMEKQVIEKLKTYKQSVITEAVTKGLDLNVPMKDSGIEWIGEIPEHWKAIKLKYEFRIKKNIAGKVGYDILSVTQKGIKIKDISNNKGQISMDYTKYQLVDINDYVMNHMDLLTGFVDCSKYVGITSPDYRVFSLINKKNSREYFKYIFQSCYTNKIFYGLGQGVSGLGRWRLQTDKFLNFSLPIPQICEQDKIATYLNNKCFNIDRAIIQKENLIEKLTQYKKSLIYECVTGKMEV